MNKQDQVNDIISAAKLEAEGKDVWGRLSVYNKYKYHIYDLVEFGEQTPYINQLLTALDV